MPGSGGIQEIPYAWLKIKWIKRPPWRKSEAVFGLCGFLCAICGEITSRGVLRGNFGFVAWRKPRRPPTRGRERGMRGRSASPFRRRAQDPRSSTDSQAGGFWYAVIFPTSINAAVRRKCSISTQRTRAICFANRAKSGGFAAAAALRRSRNAARALMLSTN